MRGDTVKGERKVRMGRALAASLAVFLLLVASACGAKKNSLDEYSDPTVVGTTTYSLNTWYYLMGSCSQGLGGLVADSLFWKGGNADFGIINAGSVRRRDTSEWTKIEPGNITLGDITLFMPFDNPSISSRSTVALVNLTGVELK